MRPAAFFLFIVDLTTILNILYWSAFVSSSVGPCPRLTLLPSLGRLLVTSTYRARLLGLIKYNASYFLSTSGGVYSGSIFSPALVGSSSHLQPNN